MFYGRKDAFALLGVSIGVLSTAPLFAGFPLSAFSAITAIGTSWLTWRSTERFRERYIDELAAENFVMRSDEPYEFTVESSISFGMTTDFYKEVRVGYDLLQRHTAIIGQSGVGKTTVAEYILWSHVSKGGGYIFIDPKLDYDQRNKMYYMALILGREDEFLVVNINDPDNSNTYNPLLDGDPDEVASRLMNLVPSTESNAGADHYKQTASYALTVIIAALQRADKLFTFGDLSILLQSPQAIETLLRIVPPSNEKRSLEVFIDQFRKPTKSGTQIDTERMKTALGGMAGRIAMFAQGKFGAVFNTVTPHVRLFDVVTKKQMLYVMLPTMGKDISALNLGKMVISDLRSACANLQQLPKSERPYPPCLALFDEFNSIVMEGVSRLFEQSRSAGIALLPAFQSFGGLRKVSPDFAEQIIQNTWNKIFFKFGSKEAEEAAEILGQMVRYVKSISYTESESYGVQLLRTDPNATDGDSAGVGESYKEQEDFRISPDKIRALGMGEAFCMVGARVYHLKTPMLIFPKDIPDYQATKPMTLMPAGKESLGFDEKYKQFLMGSSEDDSASKKDGSEKPEVAA